ncbi:helix-turn-helix domain-containing protein [Sinorhizobium medicae]|uniref:Helix-turn-helix-domain containing protein AraC type n=1 Tax=Sinorhizobium medicae (strain WSM419) TaxID=366394 RepID=A6UKT2_SINMW|nr:helix-turn-helix- domain containing protein AraC type [Sinorhizobium medicae WSM419]MDX0430818.1 helix-turn-helix domain-containing protein [Sinorhizobium medicae]MDX0444636.1 helix-turn-helix domain-containing protein [Sinorhizobium medicae]MDX0494384.1 helix-turn-helix domain-containing protein [Sinorhizobium medicae]MDX0524898.1 helix-turn-helix domain-containing protein [Sinorhizobium medicae]
MERKNAVNRDIKLLRRLLRARDPIDAEPHRGWTVTQLAKVSGVSEAYFARSFRDAFGVPPHCSLLSWRVERAAALLSDTELPIIDIAMQVGWDSIGTSGLTFRDIMGENPTALRRRLNIDKDVLEWVPHCFLSASQRSHLKLTKGGRQGNDDAAKPRS